MPGTRRIEDPKTGIRVNITRPGQRLIGFGNVNEFVKLLMKVMKALGAQGAYVGKQGSAVAITLYREDGWQGRMKVPVTRRR